MKNVSESRTRRAARRPPVREGRRARKDAAPGSPPPRIVIRAVIPEVEHGRFPVKRIVGDPVTVEADIFLDGTDVLRAVLLHRGGAQDGWEETPMASLGNDRWSGTFVVPRTGPYRFTIEAWVDPLATWQRDLRTRLDASQDVTVDLRIGARILRDVAARAAGSDADRLRRFAASLDAGGEEARRVGTDEALALLGAAHPDRAHAVRYEREVTVVVDRGKARFSAWYEMFPRSASPHPGRSGTFRDVEARLPYVAGMGFDVLYFPPIHPIGHRRRKGRNNAVAAEPGDPGSPWAIGGPEGGHKSVHSDLGTLEDFRRLVARARDHGLEIALDLAFQCSGDHPYLKEHPEWFRRRPDGTIQFAENPPKKYEDIYPFDFETPYWRPLWEELKSVVRFWMDQGIRIFRVDNPHTKPFAFWEELLSEAKAADPDVLFLSEAFTRPKVMYRLAQLGFDQSYTYFAWRTTKAELEAYFTELTQADVRDFFRPSLWTNTPDILTEYLQTGGRPAFLVRFVLAATLGANYGVYGPAFELLEHRPREPGSEEYLNSEKYEVKVWDLDRPDSLRDVITRVNRARRENPALQGDGNLRFHATDNDQILCYSKRARDNVVLIVVNLDPRWTQSGWTQLDLDALGLRPEEAFEVQDLLTDERYTWRGPRNYVELHPQKMPAHVLRVSPLPAAETARPTMR